MPWSEWSWSLAMRKDCLAVVRFEQLVNVISYHQYFARFSAESHISSLGLIDHKDIRHGCPIIILWQISWNLHFLSTSLSHFSLSKICSWFPHAGDPARLLLPVDSKPVIIIIILVGEHHNFFVIRRVLMNQKGTQRNEIIIMIIDLLCLTRLNERLHFEELPT